MFRFLTAILLITQITISSAEEGLKKVNYENETSDMNNQAVGKDTPGLTPEQLEKVKKDIEAFKANQAESQKILDELDKEDQ